MPTALRLEITDYQSPAHFALRLANEHGGTLMQKAVRLNEADPIYRGYANLTNYLHHRVPGREQSDVLQEVGEWIGLHVFGDILPAIVTHDRNALKTVTVIVPPDAQNLLNLPLDAARFSGKTLIEQNIRLIYVPENAPADRSKPEQKALRILAVFSLPTEGSPLNLRQERYKLEQFVAGLRSAGRNVELRVLQYGATRLTLEDALSDGDGWDILHFSGHGSKGVLALEKRNGTLDTISAEELEELAAGASERVKLLFLSACQSGATTVQAARQAIGLDVPTRDDKAETQSEPDNAPTPAQISTGQRLAERLGCAAIAMRYNVNDRFALDLADGFYQALLKQRQPLPRALNEAVADAATPLMQRTHPISGVAPMVFGASAAALKITLSALPPTEILPRFGMASFPPEPSRFVGRLQEMIKGREALAEAGTKRGILYHGMAGAGKTTLALELAYRYGKRLTDPAAYTQDGRFQGFVWYQPNIEGSDIGGEFARFLTALMTQLELTDNRLLAYADRPNEFNRTTLPLLINLLRQNAYLLVLDNMESLLKENGDWKAPEWEPLMAALLDPQNHTRVILTSRWVPNSLSGLPQLTQYPVHSLSFPESVIVARELPNLSQLFDTDADRALLQWTLKMVQGHPKLLELADGTAANQDALKALLIQAEAAGTGGTNLQAFLSEGISKQEEADFVRSFGVWISDISGRCAPATRLLLRFLACLEDYDRDLPIIAKAWRIILDKVPDNLPDVDNARANAKKALTDGLHELTELGLIEEQYIPDSDEQAFNPSSIVHYALHPAIARSTLSDTPPILRSLVDGILLEIHRHQIQNYRENETAGHTASLLMQAKFALPYAIRLEDWDKVAF